MSVFPMYKGFETCNRCHKPVEKTKAVWRELNASTSEYLVPGTLPEGDESQGCFAFGPDCVKAVDKNPAEWEFIGVAVRNNQ